MEFSQVLIIHTVGPRSYIIRCNYCQGQGKEPAKIEIKENEWIILDWARRVSELQCPICEGKGALRIECDDVIVPDAYCQATGHGPQLPSLVHALGKYSTLDKCSFCQGLGVRSITGQVRLIK